MNQKLAAAAEARRLLEAGRLPLFDRIAQGFFKAASSLQESGGVFSLSYLDGVVKIEGASYTRRAIVLQVEDLKQQVEAPLSLQNEAFAQMSLLKLDPIPELKFYRDIATAILRMEAALHLTRLNSPEASDSGPVFQADKALFEINHSRLITNPLPGTKPKVLEGSSRLSS
jgi:hypothetical protein